MFTLKQYGILEKTHSDPGTGRSAWDQAEESYGRLLPARLILPDWSLPCLLIGRDLSLNLSQTDSSAWANALLHMPASVNLCQNLHHFQALFLIHLTKTMSQCHGVYINESILHYFWSLLGKADPDLEIYVFE